jgi:hypothetical protein
MPFTRPTSNIQTAVQQYSPSKIKDAMLRIKSERFPSSRWLKEKNRYESMTIRKIEKENNQAPLRPNELAEYIAASSVLHCSDGWLFFSNAVEDLLNGDYATAVFMAYYAQLRAVMSFFASEGIGIFNNKHFWFDKKGKPFAIKNIGTHPFARQLIDEWANEPSSGDKLLDKLRLENIKFSDWANEAQITKGSPAISQLAKDWLNEWSIDLNILAKDHEFRNEVSYRPQRIIPQLQKQGFEDCLDTLIEFWRSSVPYGSNGFYVLDRYLLRNSLSSLYFRRTGVNPRNTTDYQHFIMNAMENLGLNPQDSLSRFLLFNSDPQEHLVLIKAKEPGLNTDRSFNVLSILSRAYILLRLSSASTGILLADSAVTRTELMFWWNEMGVELGYWLLGSEPAYMSDLWDDVKESLDNVEAWRSGIGMSLGLFNFRQDLSFEVKQLAQFNRAGLWALGL